MSNNNGKDLMPEDISFAEGTYYKISIGQPENLKHYIGATKDGLIDILIDHLNRIRK